MELRPSHKHAVPHVAERLAHLTLELFARFWHLSDIDRRKEGKPHHGGRAESAQPRSSRRPALPSHSDRTNTDTDVDWCVYNKKKNLSYHVTITAGGHESHTEPGPCSAWWKPSARQSSR